MSAFGDAAVLPSGGNYQFKDGLKDYLIGKYKEVVESLRTVIPSLYDIEIETEVTHSATSPFRILNASLHLQLCQSGIPGRVRHEGAVVEILVADRLLSTFFTISDPALRDKGLSSLFFGKILETSPQITNGSFLLTGMNGIAFMLALTNSDLVDIDRFKIEVNRVYADNALIKELQMRFCDRIKSMTELDGNRNKERIEYIFFERTPLGKMIKQFGFSHIYEVDIDITGRTPDCIVRVTRDLQAFLNTKVTLRRPGMPEAEVLEF